MRGADAYYRRIEAAREEWRAQVVATEESVMQRLRDMSYSLAKTIKSGMLSKKDKWRAIKLQANIQEIVEAATESSLIEIVEGQRKVADTIIASRYGATRDLIIDNMGASRTDNIMIGMSRLSPDVVILSTSRIYADGLTLSDRIWQMSTRAREGIEKIIQLGVAQGVSAERMAVNLIQYLVGAEGLSPEDIKEYKVLLSGVRGEEKRKLMESLLYRARRLARSELNTTYHEATAISADNSSIVKGLHWTLSARHPKDDECDVLAEADIYGLGAGVYCPAAYPVRPHPQCICHSLDVLIPPSEWREDGSKPPCNAKIDINDAKLFAPKDLTQTGVERAQSKARDLIRLGQERVGLRREVAEQAAQ